MEKKYYGLTNQYGQAAVIKELHGWVDDLGSAEECSKKASLIRDEIFNAVEEWHSDNPSMPNGINARYIVIQGTLSIVMAAFRDGTVTHSHIDKLEERLADFFTCANEVAAYNELEQRPLAQRGKQMNEGCHGSTPSALREIATKERQIFIDEKGKEPTTRELFKKIGDSENETIQEIADETIYWKHRNNAPDETTFGSFKNMHTRIKNEE